MYRNVNEQDGNILEFSGFDCGFGAYLQRCAGSSSQELMLTGALLTMELRNGNVALDLKKYAGQSFAASGFAAETICCPELNEWKDLLMRPEFAGVIAGAWQKNGRTPLVMMPGDRIMLRRYAAHSFLIRDRLLRQRSFAEELSFISEFNKECPDLQDLAVFTAINSRLLILSGGPGTGKTTVCSRIIMEILRKEPASNILFGALTGKAHRHLAASIAETAAGIEPADPGLAGLLRRCSGTTLHSFTLSREQRTKLAFCDVMIIDECSMIPMELFSSLLSELPERCRLILIGDRCQLAPIESGAVFNELCECGKANLLPNQAAEFFNRHGGSIGACGEKEYGRGSFSGFIVELQKNYRSASAPTICRISAKLRQAEAEDAQALAAGIGALNEKDFIFRSIAPDKIPGALESALKKTRTCGAALADLPELCASGDPEKVALAMKLAGEIKFIAALRHGPGGVETLNDRILKLLKILPEKHSSWLPGTLLIITENDRYTGLHNGDVGIVVTAADEQGVKKNIVKFPEYGDLQLSLQELPEHEVGFASTVHKAQGMGYEEVIFVLPQKDSGILSRELLYTAVTRAAAAIEIWGDEKIIACALAKSENRRANLLLCP